MTKWQHCSLLEQYFVLSRRDYRGALCWSLTKEAQGCCHWYGCCGAEEANTNVLTATRSVLCWWLLATSEAAENVDLTGNQWPKNSNEKPKFGAWLYVCLYQHPGYILVPPFLYLWSRNGDSDSYLVGKAHYKSVAVTSLSLAEARKFLLSSGFRVTTTIAAMHRFINKWSPAAEPIPARLSGSAQVF